MLNPGGLLQKAVKIASISSFPDAEFVQKVKDRYSINRIQAYRYAKVGKFLQPVYSQLNDPALESISLRKWVILADAMNPTVSVHDGILHISGINVKALIGFPPKVLKEEIQKMNESYIAVRDEKNAAAKKRNQTIANITGDLASKLHTASQEITLHLTYNPQSLTYSIGG